MWKPSPDYRGNPSIFYTARTKFDVNPFKVVWSDEHNCWVSVSNPDLLLLVEEVWIEAR